MLRDRDAEKDELNEIIFGLINEKAIEKKLHDLKLNQMEGKCALDIAEIKEEFK